MKSPSTKRPSAGSTPAGSTSVDPASASSTPARPARPRFQFTLTGLLVLMFVVGAATAPGYYMLRGGDVLPQSRLVGMLMLLAGPLLLMTLLSVMLSLSRR